MAVAATTNLTPLQQAQWSETKQPALYGSMSCFLVLANSAYVARLYCQWRIARPFRIDDAFLAMATLLADAIIALFLLATRDGFGLHVFRVIAQDPNAPDKLVTLTKYILVTSALSVGCLASIKLSLLFFYRRVFLVQQRWLTIAWWVNLVYIVLWFFGAFFFFIFECLPPSFYWTRHYAMGHTAATYKPQGSCNPNSLHAIFAILSLSLFSDAALLTLPGGTIAGLHVSRRKKLYLGAIFSLGIIAVAVSIGRIVMVVLPGNDPTYSICDFMILTSAEQITGIVCACGPIVLPAILRRLRAKTMSALSSKEGAEDTVETWADHVQQQARRAHGHPVGLTSDGSTVSYAQTDRRMSFLHLAASPGQIAVKTEIVVGHLSEQR